MAKAFALTALSRLPQVLDKDGDGEVSLTEFMALVKMPVKKAVKAISAANAFAAAGKNAAGETDEASYHEWLASLAPKKTQRDREHERERAWRNRPRNETSEDPRTGTGGYALPGSSAIGNSGWMSEAVVTRASVSLPKLRTPRPPAKTGPYGGVLPDGPARGMPRGACGIKRGEFLTAHPDYLLDPEPEARKFNRYYPHEVALPEKKRQLLLATQGPGFGGEYAAPPNLVESRRKTPPKRDRNVGKGIKLVLTAEEKIERQTKQIGKIIRNAISSQRSLGGKAMKNIEGVFKTIDKDGSGNLDHVEFSIAMNRLGLGLTPPQIEQCIQVREPEPGLLCAHTNGWLIGGMARRCWTRTMTARYRLRSSWCL